MTGLAEVTVKDFVPVVLPSGLRTNSVYVLGMRFVAVTESCVVER